ncbi:Lrp/AsnC family transcriptional regulator [Acinetobacter indicus]
MELDRFDKHILEILSHEDVNLNELSERVNLSVSSVHRRIKNLIDHNIISGLKREINYQKFGFSLHVLLQVSLVNMIPIPFKFLEELENIPEVINAFLVTGQTADLIVEVIARDMENYSEMLLKRIGKIDHVVALHSSFVIKEYNVLNCSNLLNKV